MAAQEAEVSRLAGIEAAADRLRAQLSAADAAVADKDSTMALLLSDKAYLTKEVEVSQQWGCCAGHVQAAEE